MAQLKNTDRIFELKHGECVTIGHNRIVERFHDAFYCRLHGHCIAQIRPMGASPVARVILNDCGHSTTTTREAMKDFARAFGCTLNVSFAKGDFSIRFKNAAGHFVERDGLDESGPNGPYAMGRYC
jgi:hypothetical protein